MVRFIRAVTRAAVSENEFHVAYALSHDHLIEEFT